MSCDSLTTMQQAGLTLQKLSRLAFVQAEDVRKKELLQIISGGRRRELHSDVFVNENKVSFALEVDALREVMRFQPTDGLDSNACNARWRHMLVQPLEPFCNFCSGILRSPPFVGTGLTAC